MLVVELTGVDVDELIEFWTLLDEDGNCLLGSEVLRRSGSR